MLVLSASNCLSALRAHQGHLCREDWGSEPFASTLAWASAGFPLLGFGKQFAGTSAFSNSAGKGGSSVSKWELMPFLPGSIMISPMALLLAPAFRQRKAEPQDAPFNR